MAVVPHAGLLYEFSARGGSGQPAVFSEYTPYAGEGMTDPRCVVRPRYKYVWSRDDRDELYDTWIDPSEGHPWTESDGDAGQPVPTRIDRGAGW